VVPVTLGIHLGHDRSASIVRDGLVHSHISEERLDRVKHSPRMQIPFRSIDALLRQNRLKISDFSGIGVTYTRFGAHALLSEFADQLRDYYGVTPPALTPVSHHFAHALSSFHTSNFRNAVVFVADGAGDQLDNGKLEAESWYLAGPRGVELVGQRAQDYREDICDNPFLYMHNLMSESERLLQMSFGSKYEQFTSLLGFRMYQEGTTMALASYGRSLVDVLQYRFDDLEYSLTRGDLLDIIDQRRTSLGLTYTELIRRERGHIARTMQAFLEHGIVSILRRIRELGVANLCLGGGVFLNCTLNHKIIESRLFDEMHVIPAAGDEGQSIGAAFHAYNMTCGQAANSSRSLPFLGLSHSSIEIRKAIAASGLPYEELSEEELITRIVEELLAGHIVGILRGRSEAGPRALCHRSLLADPRSRAIKDRLNRYIKRREMFRPFAPVVTAEDQDTFFSLKRESKYMLLSGPVKKKYRRSLAGIVHVDGSARVQAVRESDEPFVYRLLKTFERVTSFPILLNTSFNGRGEPIVESPSDAINSFLANSVDVLVLERSVIMNSHLSRKVRIEPGSDRNSPGQRIGEA
jgi:carbamoyltransferase